MCGLLFASRSAGRTRSSTRDGQQITHKYAANVSMHCRTSEPLMAATAANVRSTTGEAAPNGPAYGLFRAGPRAHTSCQTRRFRRHVCEPRLYISFVSSWSVVAAAITSPRRCTAADAVAASDFARTVSSCANEIRMACAASVPPGLSARPPSSCSTSATANGSFCRSSSKSSSALSSA